jgi:hypothetical protein
VKTETHRAINEAALKSLDDANSAANRLGLKLKKIWNSSMLPTSRDSHINLDGTEADENGDWYLNGTATQAPGLSGNAKDDVNCVCYITTEVEGI